MNNVDRLREFETVIARAAHGCGREPRDVALVRVTKAFPAEDVIPLLDAGCRVFGENHVQEAKAKWSGLRAQFPDIELHLIGPLQSNEVRDAVETFDLIESVDRENIAQALAKEIAAASKRSLLLVHVNTGAELQKAGVLPDDADAFVKACREQYGLELQVAYDLAQVRQHEGQIVVRRLAPQPK